MDLVYELVELLRRAATCLPEDVISALRAAQQRETSSLGKEILGRIIENTNLAITESKPICQDTGTPIFYVSIPGNYSRTELKDAIWEAILAATKDIPLRPNAVDVVAEKNIGNKPSIHFEESDKMEIALMLKGGGSENVSAIYQLPNAELNAHRNLDGVRKCVLDAVFKAQGKGCPPYIIGVGIGGNIEDVAHISKKQLLRKIGDKNEVDELHKLEDSLLSQINSLGIGPMGFGGNATALAIKISGSTRHPASYFVGISISCWALRRHTLCLD